MNIDIFEYFGMDENLGALIPYREHQIKSWCTDIPQIKDFFIDKNFKDHMNIVEIGVHGGASLLMTFDIIEGKNCTLTGIDCWEDIVKCGINGKPNEYWSEESLKLFLNLHKENRLNLETIVNKYDEKNQIKLIKGLSNDESILNQFEDSSIDFLYIDGDHSFDGCYSDLKNWYPKLKQGGTILNDDYSWDTVKKAVDLFCEEKKINNLKVLGNQSIFNK